jgi:hypothetical protein
MIEFSLRQPGFRVIGKEKAQQGAGNQAHRSAIKRALLGAFHGGLRFRIITDQNEMTVIRRRRLDRIRRPDNRQPLRGKRKDEQNAEGKRLHVAVLLCINCAMEIANSAASAQCINHHRPTR